MKVIFTDQSLKAACRTLTKSMSFQVLSLKILASREVIREGLDYSSYLGGSIKDELDGLGKFAGTFVVKAFWDEASVNGKILSLEEWDSRRQDWQVCLRAFWEGPEFSIFERIHDGKREWQILDIDGTIKTLQLSSRGTQIYGYWTDGVFTKNSDSYPNGY